MPPSWEYEMAETNQTFDLSARRALAEQELRDIEARAAFLRGQIAILDELIAHLQQQPPTTEREEHNHV
jgi:hypothetical protein